MNGPKKTSHPLLPECSECGAQVDPLIRKARHPHALLSAETRYVGKATFDEVFGSMGIGSYPKRER